MKLIIVLLVSVFMTALAGPIQAGVITNDKAEIPFDVFIDCANDGDGEWAEGIFRLHSLIRETTDGSGGYHYSSHFNPMGGSVVGQVTGDVYNANGVTGESFNASSSSLGSTYTYVNNFRFVGRGKAVNFMTHQNYHVTVNALGEVTAEVDNIRVTCE